MDWHGRVVVVTGASAGIGRATVRELALRGASIGLVARGHDGLDAAVKDVESVGGRAVAIPTDVADADALERAAATVERELGPIDVWINCAMTSVFAPFVEITPSEFARVTNVTYLGYAYGTHAALQRMRPRDRGVIVQVGSALAYRSIPLQSAYCGSKHAIVGMTTAVRSELMHDKSNVRITMVQLPAHNTPQFDWVLSRLPRRPQPVPPIYQPEIAARAIVHAAEHPRRREYWIGWPTIRAIALNRFAPAVLDRYLARKGVDAQQTEDPDAHDRPVNLWEPVSGDSGAHGSFEQQAKRRSAAEWMSRHRGVVTAAVATAAAVSARFVTGTGPVWVAATRRTGTRRTR
jgi:NAD(P)-dependent dehydrogenase (short-subunit alcohol dehydrogenase family)